MWRLVLKNLLRNKRRSFLTLSSVAVSLFLLSSLAIVYTALGRPLANDDTIPLLMVRRGASNSNRWNIKGLGNHLTVLSVLIFLLGGWAGRLGSRIA